MSSHTDSLRHSRARIRAFVYCLLTFIPDFYFFLGIGVPDPTSMAYWLFCIAQLSVSGVLLVLMSSLVRAHLPLCGRVRKRRKAIPAITTVVPNSPNGRAHFHQTGTNMRDNNETPNEDNVHEFGSSRRLVLVVKCMTSFIPPSCCLLRIA